MTDVAWITSAYPWEAEPIAGIFFRTQARLLVREGIGITVVTPTPWAPWPLPRFQGRWRSYADAPRTSRDERVTVLRPRYLNVPGQPSFARPDRSIAAAAARTRRSWAGAGLVHGHYSVTGLAAWRVARSTGLPLVLTFHGDDLNTWPDDHPDRVPDLRAAMRDAAAVLTVSAPLAERVRSLAGVEATHLPIGCDHERLAAVALSKAEARARLSVPVDAVVVVFVGYLLPTKGVRELVDAVVGLGDPYRLVLVGDGPLRGYGSTPGDRRIVYRGQQPNEEAARTMCAADVLVLPSYGEGLPTVLVEAGSLGIPVIASRVGGIPGLLGTDRGTLLPEVSPGAIVDALRDLADHRDAAEAAAARLRSHVLDHHSAAHNAARLAGLYRSIVGESGSGPSPHPASGTSPDPGPAPTAAPR